MANFRLIAPNAFDEAALTVSPDMVATLPETNLQDSARARVARSVGLPEPQYIRGDWVAAQTCNGFALWRHNLSGAAEIRLRLWAEAGQAGTLLYDSGAVALGTILEWGDAAPAMEWGVDYWGGWLFQTWGVACAMLWFDAVSALSFELQISDPGNSDGYVEASRIYLGEYFSPAYNFNFGGKFRWEDDSAQERTDGNSLRTDIREPYRTFRFDLAWLSEAERADLSDILRLNGKGRDMFVSLFPADADETKERDYAAAVKVVQMPDLTGNIPNNYQSELVLAEA